MMDNPDIVLAKQLQAEYDRELNAVNKSVKPRSSPIKKSRQALKRRHSANSIDNETEDLNKTCNLVHPEWETLDPTPDIFSMKDVFDDKFFQGRLKCVILEWSKKMYSCAGICYLNRNRMGMAITIRLSEPLLKLRSRKDLVETILHEMIHAYCFVLNIREGNGGHGPVFKRIMRGINTVAGTNIDVYHTFRDEVDLYKVHWWRCNGICQHRKPFFGFVKRSSNRAPGPSDFWWIAHVQSCGGTFLKIRGPEPKKSGQKKKENNRDVKNSGGDLRNYFDKTPHNSWSQPKVSGYMGANNLPKGTTKANGGDALLFNPKTSNTSNIYSVRGGNLKNVFGFKDLDNCRAVNQDTFTNGNSLTSTPVKSNSYQTDSFVDKSKLRDHWNKKFPANKISEIEKNSEANKIENSHKKSRISSEWKKLNDDIEILENYPVIIDLSETVEEPLSIIKSELTQAERQIQIKQDILETSDNLFESDIELIDGDFDDNVDLNVSAELADTTIVDDLFGDDTLLKDFNVHNSAVPCSSTYTHDPSVDIISCPICQVKIQRIDLEEHLNGCNGVTKEILPKSKSAWAKSSPQDWPKQIVRKPSARPVYQRKTVNNKNTNDALRKAGYTDSEISETFSKHDLDSSTSDRDLNNSFVKIDNKIESQSAPCPVCRKSVPIDKINEHLDNCLTSSNI